MAMLAETKRKQRWILNPRETNWSNDTTKYGQRMLERMGWTPGKGLGINEQGMTKHIRVAVKADTMGIGFKDNEENSWLEQQENFNTILKKLQNPEIDAIKLAKSTSSTKIKNSVESEYKQNRPRISCKRFTNAKNVKNYSTKDLANIFGQKDLSHKNMDTKEGETSYSKIPDTIDNENIEIDITNDYEDNTNKVINLTNKTSKYSKTEFSSENYQLENTGNNSDSKHSELYSSNFENSIVSENQCRSIKNKKRGHIFESESDLDYTRQPKHFKKLKSDKSKLEEKDGKSNEAFENSVSDLEFPSENCNNNKFEIIRTELGITNNALDLTDENDDKRRVTFNSYIEYEGDSKKKKKLINTFEVENKMLKKRKRNNTVGASYTAGIVNKASEIETESHGKITEIHEVHEINELKNKKHKRKKLNKTLTLETIEEIQEDYIDVRTKIPIDIYTVETINTDVKLCKKVSKKKIKKDQNCDQIIDLSCCSVENEVDIDKQVNIVNEQVQMEKSKDKSIQKNKKEKYDKDINIENEETVKKITSNKISFIEHLDDSVNEIARRYKQYKLFIKKGKLQKENKVRNECKDDTLEPINLYVDAEPINKVDTEKESIHIPDIKENNWKNEIKSMKRKLHVPFYDKNISDFVGSNVHKLKGYGVKT